MLRPSCTSLILAIQIFIVLQRCSRTRCLTIDSRLTPTGNDCYTRISIGTKLPEMDIVLRTNATSLTECEEYCLKSKHGCNAFSFGVGAKGNSTCLISRQIPALEDLETHPEYDVYAKNRRDSIWCDFDRFYKSFIHESENRSVKIDKLIGKGSVTNNNNLFSKLVPESMSVFAPHNTLSFSRHKNDMVNYGRVGSYDLFINHDQRFHSDGNNRSILDVIGNENGKTSYTPFVIICHRKLLPGKKMTGLFIERVVNCENLQDCCRACDYEKAFPCKGFNHRRRTDDSKCTCELTSTPHFRMDIDEDFSSDSYYDYYEKIENCPSPGWRDNSIPRWKSYVKNSREHSQNTWLDRDSVNKDFLDTDHSIYKDNYPLNRDPTYDFSNGLARPGKPLPSHYDDPHGFVPRYHDINWNRNWKGSETRYPDIVNDNVSPNSRINYNKEHFDVKSSSFSNSRLEDHSLTHEYPIPNENEQFYGKFYNYGGAFGYNDNYVSIPKQPYYEKHETSQMTRKCSVKAASGSKLSRSILRKTCVAHDFEQCEEFCTNETSFSCESFAYRSSVLTTNPTDNCLLSDRPYQDLNFYTDLEPNRDYDTYVLTPDAKNCYLKKPTNRYPAEECFSRIRSGFTMPMDITRRSTFVHDFGECQLACTTSHEFVCRSFVFKYAMDHHRGYSHERVSPNCFLSDWPAEEINPIDMPDMDGAELYERNTLSRGCEMYPPSLSNPNVIAPYEKEPSHMDELCYSEYHRPCKLMSHAIVSSMRAITKQDCRRKCSTMRNTGVIPCMSFNYITPIDDTRNNCFLSEISMRDLRPNLDYVHDNDHALYAWKDFDPYCGLIANAFNTTNAPTFDNHDQLHPPTFDYANAQRTPESETHPHEPTFYPSTRWRNKFRSDVHEHDYKHKFVNGDNRQPPFETGTFEHGLNIFHSNQYPPSRRYTVNGYPCKNSTVCQRNEINGFWSCEIENEYGSWDYCCEPSHQCGFSQGYHYPWCYVGPNEDQWRPCSETYYPYHLATDHSTYRQSPLYTARHWPIIYFHETSPPNCSTNNPDAKDSWKLQ